MYRYRYGNDVTHEMIVSQLPKICVVYTPKAENGRVPVIFMKIAFEGYKER
jgi:hypothetical protein